MKILIFPWIFYNIGGGFEALESSYDGDSWAFWLVFVKYFANFKERFSSVRRSRWHDLGWFDFFKFQISGNNFCWNVRVVRRLCPAWAGKGLHKQLKQNILYHY